MIRDYPEFRSDHVDCPDNISLENFSNGRIVFVISIRQSNTPIVISNVGKCQHITFIGWELFLKFPHPDFHSPVGTDFTESVKKFQVFLCDFKSDINLYILFFSLKSVSAISYCPPTAQSALRTAVFPTLFFPTSIKAFSISQISRLRMYRKFLMWSFWIRINDSLSFFTEL